MNYYLSNQNEENETSETKHFWQSILAENTTIKDLQKYQTYSSYQYPFNNCTYFALVHLQDESLPESSLYQIIDLVNSDCTIPIWFRYLIQEKQFILLDDVRIVLGNIKMFLKEVKKRFQVKKLIPFSAISICCSSSSFSSSSFDINGELTLSCIQHLYHSDVGFDCHVHSFEQAKIKLETTLGVHLLFKCSKTGKLNIVYPYLTEETNIISSSNLTSQSKSNTIIVENPHKSPIIITKYIQEEIELKPQGYRFIISKNESINQLSSSSFASSSSSNLIQNQAYLFTRISFNSFLAKEIGTRPLLTTKTTPKMISILSTNHSSFSLQDKRYIPHQNIVNRLLPFMISSDYDEKNNNNNNDQNQNNSNLQKLYQPPLYIAYFILNCMQKENMYTLHCVVLPERIWYVLYIEFRNEINYIVLAAWKYNHLQPQGPPLSLTFTSNESKMSIPELIQHYCTPHLSLKQIISL